MYYVNNMKEASKVTVAALKKFGVSKNMLWLAVSYALAVFSGLAVSVAFANLVPKDIFGTYKFALATIAMVGAFGLTGLDAALVRSVAKGFGGTIRMAFSSYLRWGTITLIGTFAVAGYYFLKNNSELGLSLLILGAALPLTNAANLFASYLEGKQEFKLRSLYGTIQTVIPAIVLVATLMVTANLVLIITIYALSNLIAAVTLYRRTLRVRPPDEPVDRKALHFAKHLSIMNIFNIVISQADKVLSFYFLGPVGLATYAFAISPVTQIQSAGKILNALLLPELSKKTSGEIRRVTPYRMLRLLGAVIVVIIAYVLVAPYLYRLLFPAYVDAVVYSQVFALTLIFVPITFLGQALVAQRRNKELYTRNIVSPLLRLLFLLVLLPSFGLWGAIVAVLLGRAVDFTLVFWLFRRIPTEPTSV